MGSHSTMGTNIAGYFLHYLFRRRITRRHRWVNPCVTWCRSRPPANYQVRRQPAEVSARAVPRNRQIVRRAGAEARQDLQVRFPMDVSGIGIVEWRVNRMANLPILATCLKCGRGFLTVPKKLPAYDQYGPANEKFKFGERIPVCGGRIELTHEGTRLMSTDTGSVT